MTDQKKSDLRSKKRDGSAKLIYELATDPPPKDMANIKAASDVFEANKKDARKDRRERQAAHS